MQQGPGGGVLQAPRQLQKRAGDLQRQLEDCQGQLLDVGQGERRQPLEEEQDEAGADVRQRAPAVGQLPGEVQDAMQIPKRWGGGLSDMCWASTQRGHSQGHEA